MVLTALLCTVTILTVIEGLWGFPSLLPRCAAEQVTFADRLDWLFADISDILHEHCCLSTNGQRPLSAVF